MTARKQKSKKAKIVILFFCFFVFLFFFSLALAADDISSPTIQVEIGGFEGFDEGDSWSQSGGDIDTGWISQYISVLYTYGIGVAAILAVVMIMIGGFVWLTSAGVPERIGKAKDFIISALSGLLIALFSFIILQTVNPRLTDYQDLSSNSDKATEILTADNSSSESDSTQTSSATLNDFISQADYNDYYADEIDTFLNQLDFLEEPDIATYSSIAEGEIASVYGNLYNDLNELGNQGVDVQGLIPVAISDMPDDGQLSTEWMENYLEDQGLDVERVSNGFIVGGELYNYVNLNSQTINLDNLGEDFIGTIILGNK